jgi:hypothetical protein
MLARKVHAVLARNDHIIVVVEAVLTKAAGSPFRWGPCALPEDPLIVYQRALPQNIVVGQTIRRNHLTPGWTGEAHGKLMRRNGSRRGGAPQALRFGFCPARNPSSQLLEWLKNWPEDLISLPDVYQRGPNAFREAKTVLEAAVRNWEWNRQGGELLE